MSCCDDIGCLNCDYKSSIFNSLTESQLKYMSENRYTVDYKNGELIYKQGTKSTHVISFVSGLAQVVHSDNGSNSLVLRLIKPPEFITGLGVFFDDFHHYSVSTLKQSRVCFINI
ncbi:MAG: cyclic nucleotide-binding domain-containing protein, partial [Bacteroidetes bacterium]|nr:cyclic nucleotide-binding domain-containing protein [Bacteroidota bacterium]